MRLVPSLSLHPEHVVSHSRWVWLCKILKHRGELGNLNEADGPETTLDYKRLPNRVPMQICSIGREAHTHTTSINTSQIFSFLWHTLRCVQKMLTWASLLLARLLRCLFLTLAIDVFQESWLYFWRARVELCDWCSCVQIQAWKH